jgi:formylglycine-generating enzyme required for sulfatase activity
MQTLSSKFLFTVLLLLSCAADAFAEVNKYSSEDSVCLFFLEGILEDNSRANAATTKKITNLFIRSDNYYAQYCGRPEIAVQQKNLLVEEAYSKAKGKLSSKKTSEKEELKALVSVLKEKFNESCFNFIQRIETAPVFGKNALNEYQKQCDLEAKTKANNEKIKGEEDLSKKYRQHYENTALKEITVNTTKSAQTSKDCVVCPEMVVIPSGSFLMGSPDFEVGRADDEGPQRIITLPSFMMGKTEVTQGQWKAIMGSNPSHNDICGNDCPVEGVTWNSVQEFIKKLNAKTGSNYALPSEAQWEYAARGGTNTPYWWGTQASHEYANYGENIDEVSRKGLTQGRDIWMKTAPVGQFPSNAFGLHDMNGNVSEWVQDCNSLGYGDQPVDGTAYLSGNKCHYRMIRGGSWRNNPLGLRSAIRYRWILDVQDSDIGFRLVKNH